jgi:hypothetical protein
MPQARPVWVWGARGRGAGSPEHDVKNWIFWEGISGGPGGLFHTLDHLASPSHRTPKRKEEVENKSFVWPF